MSGDRVAYARALSWLEEHRAATPELVLGANGGVLKMRIRRLLGFEESAVVSRGVAMTLLAVVAAVTIWYAGAIAHAQNGRTESTPASSSTAQSAVGPAAAPIPSEIEVDQSCRIVTMDLSDPAHPRPQYRTDLITCHTESEKKTLRWEETIDNGVKTKRLGDIREHEFLLQNPYPQPITFVVHQALPTGYRIDSDPQPNDVTNSIATFRVLADPRQTVRLHVGWSGEVLQENRNLLPVKQIGNGVSAPVLTYSIPPEYTPDARNAKTEGTVLVNLIVNEKGRPENVHVIRGVGNGLDEKAVEAVKKYKFKPARENGDPVPVELNVEINFKLF
jgi:TonB family protein